MKLFKRHNKKGFTLLEMVFAIAVTGIILMGVYSIAVDGFKKFNEYRIQKYVIEENDKFLRALGGVRFGEGLLYLDENPINHPDHSVMTIQFPDDKKIEFRPIDLGDETNDIQFINQEGDPIYTYDTDVLEFKKFEVIPLDPDVHRGGIRVHIIFGCSGRFDKIKKKVNRKVTKMFGNSEYYLDYYITYTFRNSIPPEF